MNRNERNRLITEILDAASEVHKNLGTGLLSSVYKLCFHSELRVKNIYFNKDILLPIFYKGIKIKEELVIDLLIEEEVIVQIVAEEQITQIQESYLLTALKMSGKSAGIIINFNEKLFSNSFRKFVINSNIKP